MNKIVSFPQMGNYYIPAKYLLSHILDVNILDPVKITSKTIEIGTKYSPEFVCTPFKYTLGTLIENIEKKSNILIQAGGGCKYGYYAELQEKIIKDLGYDVIFINLVSQGKTDFKKIYHEFKKIDKNFNIWSSLYYLFITTKMIRYMDKIDNYIRHNIGFEIDKNDFKNTNQEMLNAFLKTKGFFDLFKIYKKYNKKIKKIKVNKPKECLKVGIIGELYTIMEPFSNYFLETELASMNIEITRFTNVHYLLFEKKYKIKKEMKRIKKYIKYKMGADAADNIAHTKYLCDQKIDGIIHIKASFCTPEIGAMPIINKIAKEHDIPVLFFTFDANTSEVGIKTRLEAFHDMIERRKKNEKLLSRN
ncbi:MAG: 2-hydroxyacyl-CoA dehydratase [Bacilli bacterium]|nr:2-hydroxyacyl-CoA dehydratase [Bacilli bacterium]